MKQSNGQKFHTTKNAKFHKNSIISHEKFHIHTKIPDTKKSGVPTFGQTNDWTNTLLDK